MSGTYFSVYFKKGQLREALWFNNIPNKSRWVAEHVHAEMKTEPAFLEIHIRELEEEIVETKRLLEEARARESAAPPRIVPSSDTRAITPDLAHRLLQMPRQPADEWERLLYHAFRTAQRGGSEANVESLITGPAYLKLLREAGVVDIKQLARTICTVAKVAVPRGEGNG